MHAACAIACALLVALAAGCAGGRSTGGPIERTGSADLASLWVEPTDLARRDLYQGVGGPELAPDPGATYRFQARDVVGSSRGYDVTDPQGREWDVKLGPEVQPEIVLSRILWAAGYHQPPTYYVGRWTLVGGGADAVQPPARFRPKLLGRDREFYERKKVGEWEWRRNPWVGTPQMRGLVVINTLLNNWDLKTSNNAIYEIPKAVEGARRWYVVKDVGGALGQMPGYVFDGIPNDVAAFERSGFLLGAERGRVLFDYRRPHGDLLADVTAADVRWACERLARIAPAQWRDAFRAAAYEPEVAERYIRKIEAKIAEGRRLAR